MKLAVVGHTEWVEFARVDRVPAQGELVEVESTLELPAGGAAGAAMQMMQLNGSCLLLTAVGSDLRGDRTVSGLTDMGVTVAAARREVPQRRAFVYLDAEGERTITTIGQRVYPETSDPLPWDSLEEFDAVYLTAGNVETVRAARTARVVVATVRTGEALAEAGVRVDALVASANDPGERYVPGSIDPAPRWVVRTDGPRGGTFETADGRVERWQPEPLAGPIVDTYGAGDSFAGGLTWALGRRLPIEEAVRVGAFCGASALRGRGPYEGQATATELAAREEAPEPGRSA